MRRNANDMPNYRYGIRHAVWAVRTALGDSASYGDVYHEPGMESVTPNAATQNSTTFHSDEGKAATVPGASGNPTLTVQVAEYSDDYLTKVCGHKVDHATGGILTAKDDEASNIAFGYELQGTKRRTRIWWSNCSGTDPVAAAHQSSGENVTESPETVTLTVNGEKYGDRLVCREGEPGFETFLDSVPAAFTSGPAAPDATLFALTIGTLALTPAFSSSTTRYEATTTNESDAIVATPTDAGSTVDIRNGATAVESGGTATWAEGANDVVVTVTNGDATMTYAVTVTKS